MADVSMGDSEELLVTRRSRRSTAGNRMEAALAEMALDDLTKDAEDDKDFFVEKDEEDVFESDFESTDEEAGQGDAERGEQVIYDEEKEARKTARSRVEKATAAAHARQKVTFNPQAQPSSSSSTRKSKPKRRVSLGSIVNAETGEIIARESGSAGAKRHSQRKHTVMNTSATAKRMKRSEEKKAAATPKKFKAESRAFTQDELIARALDNEEGNLVEHRDYLMLEEEKRKRARVVRTTVTGPLLRWVSKVDEVKVVVEPPPAASGAGSVQKPGHPYVYGLPAYGGKSNVMPYGQTSYLYSTNAPYYQTAQSNQPTGTSAPLLNPPPESTSAPMPAGTPTHFQVPSYVLPQPPSSTPVERTEKVTKNYVLHELSQYEGVPKPSWNETMTAMFGDHVKWDGLKVYVGKNRPLSRPKQMCPITGKQARYLDPRTGVPYADLHVFETLTRILGHEFIWSEKLGCYVGHEGQGSFSPGGEQRK